MVITNVYKVLHSTTLLASFHVYIKNSEYHGLLNSELVFDNLTYADDPWQLCVELNELELSLALLIRHSWNVSPKAQSAT